MLLSLSLSVFPAHSIVTNQRLALGGGGKIYFPPPPLHLSPAVENVRHQLGGMGDRWSLPAP